MLRGAKKDLERYLEAGYGNEVESLRSSIQNILCPLCRPWPLFVQRGCGVIISGGSAAELQNISAQRTPGRQSQASDCGSFF